MAYVTNQREVKELPGKDGTGPMGLGSISGRGLGPCAYTTPVRQGCGLGLGLGRRSGFRSRFGRGLAYQQGLSQKGLLKEQRELLQRRIELIDKQLADE
jgi:hypothetical protein